MLSDRINRIRVSIAEAPKLERNVAALNKNPDREYIAIIASSAVLGLRLKPL